MPPGRPSRTSLSATQLRTLQEIERFLHEHSISPTTAELAERLGISAQSVNEQLQRLERNGYVQRQRKTPRSLVLLRSSEESAQPQQDSQQAEEAVTIEENQPLSRLIPIPIIGSVAAGVPILAIENRSGEVLVEQSAIGSGSHFALIAVGQSMVNAGIQPGDLVIVRQQQMAENRDIVVAMLEGEATVKRLHYSGGTIELHPENPRFKPIPVGPEDDLRILGKVVAVRSVSGK